MGPHEIRSPDGAWWRSRQDPIDTQVSGAIVVQNLGLGDQSAATGRLFRNPWAEKPYRGLLSRLPHWEPGPNQTLQYVDGMQLGLWPVKAARIEHDEISWVTSRSAIARDGRSHRDGIDAARCEFASG